MWFKNLTLFKINHPLTYSATDIQQLLITNQIAECAGGQRETSGWVSPFGRNNDLMVLANQDTYLIRLARQQKILPASVIKDHLLERVESIEANQQRQVGARERRELKEELEFELLPKAFTKTMHIDAWIDCTNSWLAINTGSDAIAEHFAKMLRNTLDPLSLVLPEAGVTPVSAMTRWLSQHQLPTHFQLGNECLFKTTDEEASTVTFKKHPLAGDEVETNLNASKRVHQLELIWQDKIRFLLTDTLKLKRIRFLDIMTDNVDNQGFESTEEKIDSDFALMVGELTVLLKELSTQLEIN